MFEVLYTIHVRAPKNTPVVHFRTVDLVEQFQAMIGKKQGEMQIAQITQALYAMAKSSLRTPGEPRLKSLLRANNLESEQLDDALQTKVFGDAQRIEKVFAEYVAHLCSGINRSRLLDIGKISVSLESAGSPIERTYPGLLHTANDQLPLMKLIVTARLSASSVSGFRMPDASAFGDPLRIRSAVLSQHTEPLLLAMFFEIVVRFCAIRIVCDSGWHSRLVHSNANNMELDALQSMISHHSVEFSTDGACILNVQVVYWQPSV